MASNYYFSHDFHARNDAKIQRMIMQLGIVSYGVYWVLVEKLYENNGMLLLIDIDVVSFELRVDKSMVLSIIQSFELFKSNETHFWSDSVLKRLEKINDKREKATQSAKNRWEKCERNANAMRTHYDAACERNANKVNKSKINNIYNVCDTVGDSKGEGNTHTKEIPSIDQVLQYCASAGIKPMDGEAFFHTMEGNGWTNNGIPVAKWQSTLMSWKLKGHLASQKNQPNKSKPENPSGIKKSKFDPKNDGEFIKDW